MRTPSRTSSRSTHSRTPAVLELLNRHKTSVHGAGRSALDHADQVMGITYAAREQIVPLGKGRIIVLLPESEPSPTRRRQPNSDGIAGSQRITRITMLAFGLTQTPTGLRYTVQQDYDLWKKPESGTTEPGVLDPRWPVFNAKTGRKAQGRGDVLVQALNLWEDMADLCRRVDADKKNLFELPVIPQLPQVYVTMRDEPKTPDKFSPQWTAWYTQVEREKMFASNLLPPDIIENPTGLWLAPVGAYTELPTTGQLFELYHAMPKTEVLYRAGALHELVFDGKNEFSGIELDLTQRRFGEVPQALPLNIGGATLQQDEPSPSESLQTSIIEV